MSQSRKRLWKRKAGMRRRQRAQVLVLAILVVILISSLAISYLYSSVSQASVMERSYQSERAFFVGEAGIDAAVTDIRRGGTGVVSGDFAGGHYDVQVEVLFGTLPVIPGQGGTDGTWQGMGEDIELVVKFTSIGTLNENRVAIETIVLGRSFNPEGAGEVPAAITASGNATVRGNITVDGRDHEGLFDREYTGHPHDEIAVVGDGVWGVSAGGDVTSAGSSEVGGNGIEPSGDSFVCEENSYWGNGVDDDGDGLVDEEAWDGIDNDGDGRLDEDVNSFPDTPNLLLGIPRESLRMAAILAGAYFRDANEYNQWLMDNGRNVPGGIVVFLDLDYISPLDFGRDFNDEPSIVVVSNDQRTAVAKNIHGKLKGLLLVDNLLHINGDCKVLGAVYSFAGEAELGGVGAGTAEVLYSSEVLDRLSSLDDIVILFAVSSHRIVAAPSS